MTKHAASSRLAPHSASVAIPKRHSEQLRSVRHNHDSAAPVAASSPTWPHYLTANRYAKDGMPVLA